MRLPWIQVQAEAFERAVELSALLGIGDAQALGHMVWLWRSALSRGDGAAIPDGIFTGPQAVAQLEAGARWRRGKVGALCDALVEVGLVERLQPERPGEEVGTARLRVRGLDRYGPIFVKRSKDRERKKNFAAVAPNSNGSRDESTGKTQTQTQTQRVETAATTRNAANSDEAAPYGPCHAFFSWAQDEALKRQPLRTADGMRLDEQNKALGEPLSKVGREGLERAWLQFLGDAYAQRAGFPMRLFATQWTKFHNAALAASTSGGLPDDWKSFA